MNKASALISPLRRLMTALLQGGRPNIFGILIIVAGVAVIFRVASITTYALGIGTDSSVTRSATAQQTTTPPAAATASNEEAPPLEQADINRAISAATAAAGGNTAPAPANAGTETPTPGPMAFSPTDGQEFSQTELDILQSLSKRREELDQRERNVNESAALLKAAEKEVDRKLAELNSLKAEIEKLLGTQEQVEEQRITSLVKIYEAMKPKEAATIFNTLDPDVLLSVVSRMNERRLSPILASMDPDKARMVTIRLAEQRQLPQGAATPAPVTPDSYDSPVLNLPDQPLTAPPTP